MKLIRGALVYIDANAIAAAHAVKGWNALRKGFKLATVQECVDEATRPNQAGLTLTGKTAEALKAELEVRPLDDVGRFRLRELLGTPVALDNGERDLIAAARLDPRRPWHLCGPDRATLRALHQLKLLDQMVALEEMLDMVGVGTRNLTPNMTTRWLSEKRTKLALGELLI
jgi:hypothetical protein